MRHFRGTSLLSRSDQRKLSWFLLWFSSSVHISPPTHQVFLWPDAMSLYDTSGTQHDKHLYVYDFTAFSVKKIIIQLLSDPSQGNVCSKSPVINHFLNFNYMAGPGEADQSTRSLQTLSFWKLKEVRCSSKSYHLILLSQRQKSEEQSGQWKWSSASLSATATRIRKGLAKFPVDAGICVEFCLICFINWGRKYDIVLRNVNTLPEELVAVQVKGSFLKVMADRSIHKDIPHSRGGHPQSYVNFSLDSHSSSPIKAKVGHGCLPTKCWECSIRAIRALNTEHIHPQHPSIRFSFCAYNRAANSPEERPGLRETAQGCHPSVF